VLEVRSPNGLVEGLSIRKAAGMALLVRARKLRLRQDPLRRGQDHARRVSAAADRGAGAVSLLAVALAVMAVTLLAPLVAREWLRRLGRGHVQHGAWIGTETVMQAVFRADPIPTVLIHMDSARVVEASRSFIDQMLRRPEDVEGKSLFELLEFSDPQAVRRLLSGSFGELPFCAYRIGTAERVARVRFYRIRGNGEDYACVSVLDQNELFQLSKALDGLDEALLVIRDGREIAYFNNAARRLLEVAGQPLDRWTEGKGRDHKIRAELGGLTFDVRSVDTLPPGTGQPFTLLRLRSAEPSTAATASPRRPS
jgi:PAS domain-containing protein